ncbi:50S ribosomal protein L11 methyltransferase [Pelagerythrobacter rhizovicinus]|uniref:Ribosomal protein L11 methyltransferase n=1 Tax=Pelagerythrobacter rhizovicinus TaxID=2268576 RepID=A0A4Q2KQE2_9SPHN|nr:50S ribosomal protein L11 methyltransferase [Pelagerythrobacter rhizovicinus]RXZ65793.1 50S ribosomal protein L11 methyltransferase [Pelagerythrobacter rhizovicinus]
MSGTWKLTAFADKPSIQAALVAQEDAADWDPEVVLTGFELADDRPDEWRLDAYFPREPNSADRAMVTALFAGVPPDLHAERLPDTDWVTESQQDLEPIRAGRFHVHTPDHPPSAASGLINLAIPASQAFGTGQHATTAGCLAMLDAMKRSGAIIRNLADVGTGTGLLAFAALALWPRALATASDIDPACAGVVEGNAAANGFALGGRAGELAMVVAGGMNHPLLQARAPYDLLIANILAGPLVELAPDFARAVAPGGHLLLAGLLERQEPRVRSVYSRSGFRLASRLVNGDWSILWLRRRKRR